MTVFWTATPASIHRAQMFQSEFPSWKHERLQRKQGTFDCGGKPPQMVGWDGKQGHPETAASSFRTFFTVAWVVIKEWCHSDSYHHNKDVFLHFWDAFLHHGEPAEFLQVVLVSLSAVERHEEEKEAWGWDCLLRLDQIQSSLSAMTAINCVHSM